MGEGGREKAREGKQSPTILFMDMSPKTRTSDCVHLLNSLTPCSVPQKARKEGETKAGKSFTLVTGQALGPSCILKRDTGVPGGNGVRVVHTWKIPV